MENDTKLAETLKALERGEKPPCPKCGSAYLYADTALGPGLDSGPHQNHHWQCKSATFRESFYESRDCLVLQIAALAEEKSTCWKTIGNQSAELEKLSLQCAELAAENERLREERDKYRESLNETLLLQKRCNAERGKEKE